MSELSNTIQGLFEFLTSQGMPPPTRDVRILEIRHGATVDDLGRLRIRRNEFVVPNQYQRRFDELMTSGRPWINVSCYGVQEGKLVVAIEYSDLSSKAAVRTSVNYSGPTKSVVEQGWDAAAVLVFE